MTFREIRLEDRDRIEKIRSASGLPYTAYAFPALFAWREAYGLTIALEDDFFVIHSEEYGGYFRPCGERGRCYAYMKERPESFFFLTEEESRFTWGRECEEDRDLNEYICSTKALSLIEGETTPNYRRRLRKFCRSCRYDTEIISDRHRGEMEEILTAWEQEPDAGGREDLDALRELVSHREALGITGLFLRTESGERAFIMGYENLPDQYTMTGFLCDETLPRETICACVHELAKWVSGTYPYCNLEEDLGLTGLRQAKSYYAPLYYQRVFRLI